MASHPGRPRAPGLRRLRTRLIVAALFGFVILLALPSPAGATALTSGAPRLAAARATGPAPASAALVSTALLGTITPDWPTAPTAPKNPSDPSVTVSVPGQQGQVLQIIMLVTILGVAPAILLLCTSFTKIVVVLSLTRSALGTPSIPPNQVLVG